MNLQMAKPRLACDVRPGKLDFSMETNTSTEYGRLVLSSEAGIWEHFINQMMKRQSAETARGRLHVYFPVQPMQVRIRKCAAV
jgi:hypothetical protein